MRLLRICFWCWRNMDLRFDRRIFSYWIMRPCLGKTTDESLIKKKILGKMEVKPLTVFKLNGVHFQFRIEKSCYVYDLVQVQVLLLRLSCLQTRMHLKYVHVSRRLQKAIMLRSSGVCSDRPSSPAPISSCSTCRKEDCNRAVQFDDMTWYSARSSTLSGVILLFSPNPGTEI
ncbi:hypothetical protein GQ43DRAFT_226718 [Delitschia confertaspora ATCC 74209]|uniref:Uncharacterized protein n=1 Tax=Delitschia confertaspora ATCC 74209 TaxID=1513339 RepID=A0A9P4JD82_9PLEO|nr:hypothetical protein GQ43DRAFT_226718 [Delitschia confertaspora ATCC 74209]